MTETSGHKVHKYDTISYVISLLEVSSSFKLPSEAASSVRKLIAGLPFDTRTRTFILLRLSALYCYAESNIALQFV